MADQVERSEIPVQLDGMVSCGKGLVFLHKGFDLKPHLKSKQICNSLQSLVISQCLLNTFMDLVPEI